MIDFQQTPSGEISTAIRFSDLYASALATKLSGALMVSAGGDRVVFFVEGNPLHVAAIGGGEDMIGTILVEMGVCPPAAIEGAFALQQASPPEARPLIGAILTQHGDATPAALRDAVLHQTTRRLARLFGVEAGTWQVAEGSNERTLAIGVPMAGWSLLLGGLKQHASEAELRDVVDALLGKAIRLTGTPAYEALGFDAEDHKVVELLAKPRKPDQVERRIGDRRAVRAVIKTLGICGHLELLSARDAIPIKAAVRVPIPTTSVAAPPPVATVSAPEPERPKVVAADTPVVKELRELHKKLRGLSFFDLLDVTPETSGRAVRMRYTTLARKFHPDSFGTSASAEVQQLARDVASALNEAYSTLENDDERAKYAAKLGSGGAGKPVVNDSQREAARVKFEMGNVLLKKGDTRRARDYFHFAMANDAGTPRYKAFYAWAIFADKGGNKGEALETAYTLMSGAAAHCIDDAQIQLFAGKVYRARGDHAKAKEAFERVLGLDENNDAARAELRLIKDTGRPSTPPERGGKKKKDEDGPKDLLSKLFKRGD